MWVERKGGKSQILYESSFKLGSEAKQRQNFCFISLFLVPCPVSPCDCFIQKIPHPNIDLRVYSSCQVPYSSIILLPDFYMELYKEHLVMCLIPCKKKKKNNKPSLCGGKRWWYFRRKDILIDTSVDREPTLSLLSSHCFVDSACCFICFLVYWNFTVYPSDEVCCLRGTDLS